MKSPKVPRFVHTQAPEKNGIRGPRGDYYGHGIRAKTGTMRHSYMHEPMKDKQTKSPKTLA